MYNAAIIGVSGFGNVHYNDLLRESAAGRLKIVAAAIINQDEEVEKCAVLRQAGCRIYSDYRQMLEEWRGKIDLCCVPTGIAMHEPMTVAALEAGANVYVEKPVAPTAAAAARMSAAATAAGRFAAVGFQSIYQPEAMFIKKTLLSGRLGKVLTLKAFGLWPRSETYYHRNSWAGHLGSVEKPILDSPFTNALAHYLNLPLFYAGESLSGMARPQVVRCGIFRANKAIESCDISNISIECADGKKIFFYAVHACNEEEGPISQIVCEKGVIDYDFTRVTVRHADGGVEQFTPTPPGDEVRRNVFAALKNRIEAMRRGEKVLPDCEKCFICSTEMAAVHMLVSNAAFDATPIRNVPDGQVRQLCRNGMTFNVVPGIEAAVRKAFAAGRLLDGGDFAWAEPGGDFGMENYSTFSGKYL